VAVAIAADIVPITGENRVLCYFGLKKINESPSPGFLSIIKQNSFKKDLSISDLVFVIAPRINAAGRIKHASDAVRLLIAENEMDASPLANQVNTINLERKELDQEITLHAIQILENDVLFSNRKSTVVYHESWHKGVVGIVASRLVEKYYRPTIVLTKSNGKLTGSARSVNNFDVYEAIECCSHLLEQFGGHKYAAGLTLHEDNFKEFYELFDKVVSDKITSELLEPSLFIDKRINFNDITPKFCRILKQFAPFGPGNLNPVFATDNVEDTGWAKIVGNNHLKLELFQKDNPNHKFSAIGFNLGDYISFFQEKRAVSIAYSIEENEWNGLKNIQLVLKSIKNS
jgi:single-stranded-DNA-specific exonuclease